MTDQQQPLVRGGNVTIKRKPVRRILLTPVDAIIGFAIYTLCALLDLPLLFVFTHSIPMIIAATILNSLVGAVLSFNYIRHDGYAPLASFAILLTGTGAFELGMMFLHKL